MRLYEWQSECLNLWAHNGHRGIVKAVTGSGKTFLALSAIRRLETVSDRELRVKIVVPQTFLAGQWREEIKRWLGVSARDIGVLGGNRRDRDRKYMVYVVNSARYRLARHILADLDAGRAVFLIADECHHYGSPENTRIFDFYKMLSPDDPYYALGLSATPEIADFRAITVPLGREVYCYGLGRALRDNVISRFILFSVGLKFYPEEEDEYAELSDSLAINLRALREKRPELAALQNDRFFAHLHNLAQKGKEDIAQLAQAVLSLTYRRRSVSHMAKARHHCALSLVASLPGTSRVILFCERIQAAEHLYRCLCDIYLGQAGLYHSQISRPSEVLERYHSGELRLLVCCKALDEGLNIPSTDAGVIISSTKSARQRVQRLGRLLRRSQEVKRIYYLYIDSSNEDTELVRGLDVFRDDVPMIAFSYQDGKFENAVYEKLRQRIFHYVLEKNESIDKSVLNAMNKNLSLALLRGDFLQSEQKCREMLRGDLSAAQRNYRVSVLYAVLARLGKI